MLSALNEIVKQEDNFIEEDLKNQLVDRDSKILKLKEVVKIYETKVDAQFKQIGELKDEGSKQKLAIRALESQIKIQRDNFEREVSLFKEKCT